MPWRWTFACGWSCRLVPRGVDSAVGWSRAQRVLHWSIVALVLSAAAAGIVMTGLSLRQMWLKFQLYQLHKTLGITVFALAAAQVALHWRRGRPDWNLAGWQRRGAQAVHGCLFALLLAIPLLGYVVAATSPVRVPTLFLGLVPVPHLLEADKALFEVARRVHFALAMAMLVLVAGHAAMAIAHQLGGRGTLRRMWRG